MYTMIKAGYALLILILFTNSCSSKEEITPVKEATYLAGSDSTVGRKLFSKNKMYQAIIDGGRDAGWRMTPFKSNGIIAEYLDGDDSLVVTVYFDSYGYDFSPEGDISDLREAIDKRLETK